MNGRKILIVVTVIGIVYGFASLICLILINS